MKVSTVVSCWNNSQQTISCVKSLEKVAHPGIDFEILIVDNGSTDGSHEILTTAFPGHKILLKDTYLGQAEGINVGIRLAIQHNADFVWIINPNIEVDLGSLIALYEAALKYRDTGILGSKVYCPPERNNSEKVILYAGGIMDWTNLVTVNRGSNELDEHQYDRDIDTDYVSWASMFIRIQVLFDIGLFDSRYFQYYEENDFCQRAHRHGWRLMYIWRSIVRQTDSQNDEAVSSSLHDYYTTRNKLLFGFRFASIFVIYSLIKESVRTYLRGRPWQRRGVIDFFTRRFGPGSYQP